MIFSGKGETMTVSANYSPDKSLGNGVTTEFTGNWNPINSDNFRLYLEAVADGTRTLQTLGSDYTLEFDTTGYTATMDSAPSSSFYVVRERDMTLAQTQPYRTSQGFQGQTLEATLDSIVSMVQGLNDKLERAVTFISASGLSGNFKDAPIDNYLLVWDGVSGDIRNSEVDITNIEDYGEAINTNIDDIITVADNLGDITTVADNDANITTVATNIADVNTFANVYNIVSSDPASSTEGYLIYNSTSNVLKVWNGSAWIAVEQGVTANSDVTWTGTHVFQGLIDVNNINAEGSAGGTLRNSGGTNCASWGGGGGQNFSVTNTLSFGAGGASVTGVLDEDDMLSNSATKLATQQSIKAYVDNEIAGLGTGDLLSTNNLSDVASASTAFNNIKQSATTSATGVVELATSTEINSGTSGKVPTTGDLIDAQYVCKAWVNFNGTGTVSIRDDYNVSSITDLGTGLYRVNFSSNMSNTSYSVSGSALGTGTATRIMSPTTLATSNVEIATESGANTNTDCEIVCVAIFGD